MKNLFKNKALSAFLVITFVALAGYGATYFQLKKIPHIVDDIVKNELAKEQFVREIEVSIWEAANAVYYYTRAPKELSLKEYKKQLKEVEHFSQKFDNVAYTPQEKQVFSKFESKWKVAVEKAEELIRERDELNKKYKMFNKKIHVADDVIDYKIQTRFLKGTKNVLEKEQAVREVEVSLWEAANALNLFLETQSLEDKKEYKKQIKDINKFWAKYTKLVTHPLEQTHINEFNTIWKDALSLSKEVEVLSVKVNTLYTTFWEAVKEADAILDYQLQEPIFSEHIAKEHKEALAAVKYASIFLFGGALSLIVFALGGVVLLLKTNGSAQKEEEHTEEKKAA